MHTILILTLSLQGLIRGGGGGGGGGGGVASYPPQIYFFVYNTTCHIGDGDRAIASQPHTIVQHSLALTATHPVKFLDQLLH